MDSAAKLSSEMNEDRIPPQNKLDGVRLLFVAPDDYPAFRVDLVELFSNHLVARGMNIDWSLRPCEDGPARVEARGAERFYLARREATQKFGSLRYRLRESWLRLKLLRHAARGEYDLIQVRDQPLWAIPFGLAGKLAGTPCVFWMSYPVLDGRLRDAVENLVPMSWAGRLLRIAYAVIGNVLFHKIALPLSSHTIVQSKRMRERVNARGIPLEKMTPLPMGVSTERYNAALIETIDDPRLAGRKSMAYLCADFTSFTTDLTLEALARLVALGHDAVLVLIGAVSSFEREKLGARLQELSISDRVIFTGRLPLREALAWVKTADVCLSPFSMDIVQQVATPTKLVEYLGMGRPVVATVHYDQNEVINESGAGFITDYSGEAIAEGVARLFDDAGKAEAMGARGPAWIRANRDYAHLADIVEQVYVDLLAASHHG